MKNISTFIRESMSNVNVTIKNVVKESEKAICLNVLYYTSTDKDLKSSEIWFPKSCCKKVDDTHYEVWQKGINEWIDKRAAYMSSFSSRAASKFAPNFDIDYYNSQRENDKNKKELEEANLKEMADTLYDLFKDKIALNSYYIYNEIDKIICDDVNAINEIKASAKKLFKEKELDFSIEGGDFSKEKYIKYLSTSTKKVLLNNLQDMCGGNGIDKGFHINNELKKAMPNIYDATQRSNIFFYKILNNRTFSVTKLYKKYIDLLHLVIRVVNRLEVMKKNINED